MNRTQRITSEWLLQSGWVGDELLLEALLRRGFLVYRDDLGVWLGTGSHPSDIDVLRFVDRLEVDSLSGHKDRMAQLKSQSTGAPAMDVAVAIVSLPKNHFGGHSLWTGWGIPGFLGNDGWDSFRKMAWGTKLPTCPMQKRDCLKVNNALDLGVALLVKAFPLARVATRACCDGHGEKPAWISFHFQWDAPWAKAVFDILGDATPNSTWIWGTEGGDLHVAPRDGFSDTEMLGMLNDIQYFARRLLLQSAIDKIGRARGRTLDAFGSYPPTSEHFAQEARRQLAEEFA